MHDHGGVCFADFAASAPDVLIDMHPPGAGEHLDAVYFSPHKFLGGPGFGVMVFNRALYRNRVPDHPGGGTVEWTNPWLSTPLHRQHRTPGRRRNTRVSPGDPRGARDQGQGRAATSPMLEREHAQVGTPARPTRAVCRGCTSWPPTCVTASRSPRSTSTACTTTSSSGCSAIASACRHGVAARARVTGHHLLHVTREQSRDITSRIDGGDLFFGQTRLGARVAAPHHARRRVSTRSRPASTPSRTTADAGPSYTPTRQRPMSSHAHWSPVSHMQQWFDMATATTAEARSRG